MYLVERLQLLSALGAHRCAVSDGSNHHHFASSQLLASFPDDFPPHGFSIRHAMTVRTGKPRPKLLTVKQNNIPDSVFLKTLCQRPG
jgi:hypothetical protein